MKRDILNHLGEKIGEMEQSDSFTEEQWAEALAVYARPPVVRYPPISVRQLRQAIVLSGVQLAEIDAQLSSLPEPTRSLALIEWEYGTTFRRENNLLSQVKVLLAWSDEDLNNLWQLAMSL